MFFRGEPNESDLHCVSALCEALHEKIVRPEKTTVNFALLMLGMPFEKALFPTRFHPAFKIPRAHARGVVQDGEAD